MRNTFYIPNHYAIPEKDFSLICDVVDHYPGASFLELEKILRNIFLSDIRGEHLILLGVAIGEKLATCKEPVIINQIFTHEN